MYDTPPVSAWRKTVKGRVMSNVSMTLYWWIQQHFPYELVKDEDEWDAIGGDVFEKPEII
ncbi:GM15168 [Drosophila sechellia]|uniref:GM15168 n=1 Tax=Drosophila sechellia TaxID=7238 RepID=B4HX87_DROSE|nr:GM15168 [Drosophila sechellia]